MNRSPFRARIEWLRAPLESELPNRVARAALLVHLSADEGTPVTPLEAFALGTPVLATRLPAFEEALAGLATLLPNEAIEDPPTLSHALEAALSSPPDQEAARTHLASHYTWHHCATQTLTTWQSLTSAHR
jgi:glycosyltransferase involved in cell wall biosynthesis